MALSRLAVCSLLGMGWLLTSAGAADLASTTTVTLEQVLHLTAPEGSSVTLEPGSYAVEAGESGLRLTKGTTAVLVQAQTTQHTEQLSAPMALVIPSEGDIRHLVLLQPDGQGLDAIGSLSAIQSRGATGYPVLGAAQIAQGVQQATQQAAASGTAGVLQGTTLTSCGGPFQLPTPAVNPQYPSPPAWTCPGDGVVLRDIQPATTQLGPGVPITFSWGRSQGAVPAAYYQVCAWVEGSSDFCNRGPGGQLVLLVQAPASQTTLVTRIPVTHQGKAFRWAVRACKLTPDTDTCNATPARRMTFAVSPPLLSSPTPGATASLTSNVFEWQAPYVNGVSHFLVCVAKPGVSCLAQSTLRPDVIVKRAEIHLTRIGSKFVYSLFEDLTRFAGEHLNWSVAACGSTGCEYQQQVRALTVGFGTPVLQSPSDHALIPRPSQGTIDQSNLVPLTFRWLRVPGAVTYKLCLARIGVECQPVDRRHEGTLSPYQVRPYREYVGPLTTATLNVDGRFWNNTEGGFPYQWTVSACTAANVCHTSPPRSLQFQIRQGSFYWLYPYFQQSKCTTCHSMASTTREGSGLRYTSPKRQQHVTQGRFPANTNVSDGTICARCHRADTGFVDDWRAPGDGQDFIGVSVGGICRMSGGLRDRRSQIRSHLKDGPRVMWAIRHMPGVTENEWFQLVDAWTAGPDTQFIGGQTSILPAGCPSVGPQEE